MQSLTNKDIYIGYTKDLKTRYKDHTCGKSRFTKSMLPIKLLYCEIYINEKDARTREKNLKKHRLQKEFLINNLTNSLIE